MQNRSDPPPPLPNPTWFDSSETHSLASCIFSFAFTSKNAVTVNVQKKRILKIIIFPAVNCVSEKGLVFEVLECGLYHEPKRHKGAQWLSGRVLDSRPKGSGFEPHRRHCVVVLEQDTFIQA